MNIVKYTSEYEGLKENFTCGNVVIDNFLRNGNALDENQGITYVLLSDKKIGHNAIIIIYKIFFDFSNNKKYCRIFKKVLTNTYDSDIIAIVESIRDAAVCGSVGIGRRARLRIL